MTPMYTMTVTEPMTGNVTKETLERTVVAAPYRRALARLRLRLRQSFRAYSTAADLTSSAKVAGFAGERAGHRADALARLEAALLTAGVKPPMRSDIAGWFHRRWMRVLAWGSHVTLKREIDRSEAALERATRAALEMPATVAQESDYLRGELLRLLQDVVVARDRLRTLPAVTVGGSR